MALEPYQSDNKNTTNFRNKNVFSTEIWIAYFGLPIQHFAFWTTQTLFVSLTLLRLLGIHALQILVKSSKSKNGNHLVVLTLGCEMKWSH